MDFSALLRARSAWERFSKAHPQFPLFLQALRDRGAVRAGAVVEIIVTPENGGPIRSKLRLTAEDMESIGELSSLGRN